MRISTGIWALALLGLALPATAETGLPGGTSRMAIFKSQLKLINTRLAVEYAGSDRLKPKRGGDDGALPRYDGAYRGAYLKMAKASARAHGVPEDLFLRLVQQESGWSMGAVSVKGAVGLAQLMPDTAARLGVDIHDPAQNLEGGARYLKMMYDRFGSWKLALAAYNAGPLAVDSAHGVPAFAETQNYVVAILGG